MGQKNMAVLTMLPTLPGYRNRSLKAWLIVAAGFLLLYLPTFFDLFNGIWKTDENGHGPIILALVIWFFCFRARQLLQHGETFCRPAPISAAIFFISGLFFYAIGRSQGILVLEVGSLIPVLAGCTVMVLGNKALARMWFAFFFMLFVIPLPASLADALTQPMKIAVSFTTEHILHWGGYPIARNGVVLVMGQYQLLVADACAGLHSLFTLEALGLLYMNIVRHQSIFRNASLAALIIPISFTANVIRVIALALITYYFGDAAGQGFLHGFAGMLLFVIALLLIFGVDSLIGAVLDSSAGSRIENGTGGSKQGLGGADTRVQESTNRYDALRINIKQALVAAISMLFTAATAYALAPSVEHLKSLPRFDKEIPSKFGEWREIPSPFIQIDLAPVGKDSLAVQLYDEVLMRTYVNSQGEQVMLALAYGRQQRQDIKIHRPEICYPAQGFQILRQSEADFLLDQKIGSIHGKRLLAQNGNRTEAVSYWIRIGGIFPRNGWEARWYIFREGMAGRIPDGILVRASSMGGDVSDLDATYKLHMRFLDDLVNSLSPTTRAQVIANQQL